MAKQPGGHARTGGRNSRHDTFARLPTIVATLIVVGDADAIIDWRNSPLMAVHIEGAQLHVLSGLRHGPAMERPDLVNSLLLDFLAHRRAS